MAILYNNKYNAVGSEITQGKINISKAINAKGGTATEFDSFQELAGEIANIPMTGISPDGIEWSNELTEPPTKAGDIFAYKDYIVRLTSNVPTLFKNAIEGMSRLVELDLLQFTTFTTKQYIISNCPNLKILRMPALKHLEVYMIYLSAVEELYLDSALSINGLNGYGSNLRKMYLPSLNTVNGITYAPFDGTSLIDIVTGANFSNNVALYGYDPTTAKLTTTSSLVEDGEPFVNNNEKWNYLLREHFAKNLQDRTGMTAYTITFGSINLEAMEQATIEAFTNKNWNLA